MAKNKQHDAWILIYRSLLDSPLWTSEPFTTGQAWVDLIGLANFADYETFYKGHFQNIRRGQIFTSIRWLSQRWHWSKARTARTLKSFEKAKMVTLEVHRSGPNSGTVLTIENYEKYQSGRDTTRTANGTTPGTAPGTTAGTQKKEYKEELKEPKELHGAYGNVALSGRQYQELISLYGEETLADLIEALSEYKEATGKNYKNDAAAVWTFARNRTPKREESSFSKEY